MGPRIFIRGYHEGGRSGRAHPVPSMGPRIFIRGYLQNEVEINEEVPFNGAADFHPRIHQRAKHLRPRQKPSMGPRIFIRGYLVCQRPRYWIAIPSMGPRIFIRGYLERLYKRLEEPIAFNGAADFHPRILRRGSGIL